MNTLTSRLRDAADYASTRPLMAFGPDISRLETVLSACDARNGDDAIICTILANGERFATTGQDPELTLQLLQTATITDDDMSATFGPAHHVVKDLIHQVSALTVDQVSALSAEFTKHDMAPARGRAWLHIDRIVWRAVRRTVENAATKPVTTDDATWHNAKDAVSDAICAVAGRHLVTSDAFAAQDYSILTSPWRAAFGRAHPADMTS
jgi:hypothetical protein